MKNLLFIDDDIELLKINQKYFNKKGYNTFTLSNLNKLEMLMSNNTIDCVLLDIMMPQKNGYEVLKFIQESYNVPVIFISGNILSEDKIKGLLLGASDYITKPYDFGELEARIIVQLRSSQPLQTIGSSSLKIDISKRLVTFKGDEIILSTREYELLSFLMKNPNQILTYEVIATEIWGVYSPGDKNTLMVTSSRLRKKLKAYKELDNIIESVRSVGYKFISK